jgi:hypothetical protein
MDAPFNAYAKQNSPTCLPNTRVGLLQDIYSWADRQDERCIFFLNGLAGTGKSTVAKTVARRYFDQRRLGASFFFSRGGGDVGRAEKFVTSTAVQLANTVRSLRRHVSSAITEHGDIATRSLGDQWRVLVLDPLSKLEENVTSYVLVIDALDECEGDDNIRIVLRLLAAARSLKRIRLRILLTSRPGLPIRHGFQQLSAAEYSTIILHSIAPSIVDNDISTFLAYNLELIGQEHGEIAGWPGPDVLKTLVQSASRLFIWAATACRFISDGLFADERLRTLLLGQTSDAASPEEHLNNIYVTVLQNSIQVSFSEQEKAMFYSMLRDVLGSIVVLFSPLSITSLSILLNLPKPRVDRILKDVHTVLDIPSDRSRPIRLHHPSFRDFLLDKTRCEDRNFWIDEKETHRKLTDSCLQLLSTSLKQDICHLERPGVFIADVERSRVEQYLTSEVQYASLFWVHHLEKAGIRLHDDDKVHQFLQAHFLHWLEALSLIGRLSDGVRMITVLASMVVGTPMKYGYLALILTRRILLGR